MFKALLAASLAMFVCCAAAALAGPVHPVADRFHTAHRSTELTLAPLHLIGPPPPAEAAVESLLNESVMRGFVPVSLSDKYAAHTAAPDAPEGSALPDPPVQPAIIPLPSPLYACLALLAIAVVARRAVARAC